MTRPILGFKAFDAIRYTLAGMKLMCMVKNGQVAVEEGEEELTPAEQFFALAA